MIWKKIKENLILAAGSVKTFFIKLFTSRIAVMGIAFAVLFSILIVRLFNLQIVLADYYTENYELKSQKTIEIQGARGNIYDCNGVLLAHNELAYNVTMTDEIESSSERGTILNSICDQTVKIIEENGDTITVDFNIELDDDGNYVFKEDPDIAQITFLVNIFGLTSSEIYEEGYDEYTAEQIIEYMVERFDIADTYTKEEVLKIATLRYALSLNSYQKYVSTEIAEYVSEETKAAILEASNELTGVTIEETYKRVYDYGEYVAAILGYTGEISEDELDEYNADNLAGITYSAGDIVGKAGVEKTYDSYLQGTKGSQTVYVNTTGTILEVVDETASESGNDLYLTIDIELQIVAYTILEQEIASALVSKIVNYDYDPYTDHDTSTSYVYIPVKDVYFQLLTNVVDYDDFDDDDASDREKSTLAAFESKRETVINEMISELTSDDPTAEKNLSDEYDEYMDELYSLLKSSGLLVSDNIDTDDEVYEDWADEKISLKEFLEHAIEENWLDLTVLDSDTSYMSSDEIYEAVVAYIPELLYEDDDFTESLYYYMVYDGDISAYTIIYMMYDQGILEYDDAYDQLVSGQISTYTYVINQISDLVITPAMVALDPCSGSLVITDTDTGKVLAMATYPSYDNNLLSGTIDEEYWEELVNDDSTPLYNRSTQTLTAPGSTYKMVTAITALAEGYTTISRTIYDAHTFTLISPSPKCNSYHGTVNVQSAITYSCNYYFYQLGYEMGLVNGTYDSDVATDLLEQYTIALGLGVKSGVEIEEASPSISSSDSVRSAIGQSTNAYAPVQLARYATTLANRGVNYQLSLIDRVDDSDGNTIVTVEPLITNTVELTDEQWDVIQLGMRNVIAIGGTAHYFTDLETPAAGKTGTSQENLYRSSHVTYIGFAPYGDPEIAFACVIRNGGSTAYPATVLCEVLQYYFGEITYDDVMNSVVNESLKTYVADN